MGVARLIAGVSLMVACTSGSSRSGTGFPSAAADGSVRHANPSGRVLAQNRYWAKSGKADEVYRWRMHASDVQAEMGLRRGRVFRGAGGEEPDVIWQVELTPDEVDEFSRTQKERMAVFQPVMDRMSTLLRRFESSSYVERDYREVVRPDEVESR